MATASTVSKYHLGPWNRNFVSEEMSYSLLSLYIHTTSIYAMRTSSRYSSSELSIFSRDVDGISRIPELIPNERFANAVASSESSLSVFAHYQATFVGKRHDIQHNIDPGSSDLNSHF